ncbi:large ribosomal subunit protein bL9m-like [Watersipora subatra]|uniref:large ribosomal subunit protein bL9m-like n=1 Tax=Watersipora subatra TaxID=2589382 RepID=UPI00355AF512
MASRSPGALLISRFLQFQPNRTKVILRRVNPLPLHRMDASVTSRKMKERDYLYSVVQNKYVTRRPEIECILTTHVDNLGARGQVVMVDRMLFRQYLYPTGAALYASPQNLAELKNLTEGTIMKTPHALQMYRLLCGMNLPIKMNHFKPWTLSKGHVMAAFRHQGIIIDSQESITLPQEPITNEHNEQVPFEVKVTVNGLDVATVTCYKQPYTTNPDREGELPASLSLPLHRPKEEVAEELKAEGLYYGTTDTV